MTNRATWRVLVFAAVVFGAVSWLSTLDNDVAYHHWPKVYVDLWRWWYMR